MSQVMPEIPARTEVRDGMRSRGSSQATTFTAAPSRMLGGHARRGGPARQPRLHAGTSRNAAPRIGAPAVRRGVPASAT